MAKKTNLIKLNKEVPKDSRKVVYPKIKLFFDHILTTSFRQSVTPSGLLLKDNKGNLLTRQRVVAVGPNAGVKIGDEVELDPERFKVKYSEPKNDVGPDVKELLIPMEVINGVVYLFLTMRELKWAYDTTKR